MRAGTVERRRNARSLIGVIAVSLVAMFAAALVPVPTAAAANATTSVFAGYQATSQSAFGSASVKFKVPAVQCSFSTLNFFGSFVDTLNGPGEAAVAVFCPVTGPPLYGGLIGGESTSFAPRPGDLVRTTVTMSSTAGEATLYDLTQGLSQSMSFGSLPGPAVAYDGVSSDFCVFGHCGVYVANFGTIWMFGARLNGVTPRMAGATAVDMQKPPGLLLEVATSALNPPGVAWARAWAEVWENP